MITEDYCSYKVAKLLKEKGFPINEHLFMYVNKDGKLITDHQACLTMTNEEYRTFFDDYIPTVTQALAMKWLREEQGIVITIDYDEDKDCEDNERYGFTVYRKNKREIDLATFPTYEYAVEAALKYCLTELI
jgi:hypothetical protein